MRKWLCGCGTEGPDSLYPSSSSWPVCRALVRQFCWCFPRVVRCSRLSCRCARNPSCRNGGKALHSVPYALMCWTPLFEREIAKFTIAEFKTFSEEKDIWWAPVSSARGVLMNVQARETGALSVGEDGVEIHSPVQFKR